MAHLFDEWGSLQGSTEVIEQDAKEYEVRYPRGDGTYFRLIFREKKRPIGFRSWE